MTDSDTFKGYCIDHATEAQGVALAYGVSIRTAAEFLCLQSTHGHRRIAAERYPLLSAAFYEFGPLRMYKSWELGCWVLDGREVKRAEHLRGAARKST